MLFVNRILQGKDNYFIRLGKNDRVYLYAARDAFVRVRLADKLEVRGI
jgi:hypothetical protein